MSTANTNQPDMRTFVRTWQQNGITLSAGIAPCCWMYNSPLQIIVKIGEWTGDFIGTEHVYDRTKRFEDATPELVAALTAHIALVPCKNRGCNRTAFDPVAFQHDPKAGGRMGECEECWTAKWKKRVQKLQEREAAKELREDAKQKAKGYKFKITAWIHPKAGGDDYQSVWYVGGDAPPSTETIQSWIKKKSRVTNDFKVTAL